jgi:glycosyltransferase involved in cell wall biosynthesis
MRIVLSNASARWGGVHTVNLALARGLRARGHEVVVFGRRGTILEREMDGVAPFEPVLGATDLNPLTVARAARALRRLRADVVVAMTKKDVRLTAVASRIAGVPVVIRHANEQPLPAGLRGRLLYSGATHLTNAEATKRTILASAPWLPAERVVVIHNGIDAAPWDAAEPLDLGLPAGAVAFGFVGAFERRKGLHVLADAWPVVANAAPGAHLLLAGRGSKEEMLRAAFAITPRVHWLGHRTDVPRVMASLDVLVLPSLVEGAPNVVQEAMAAGIAIVATAVSGTPELVRDRVEARLVPARDPRALADAMLALARDPAERARLAAAAHARVRAEFSLDGMIDAYEALLARVVGSGKPHVRNAGPAKGG